jgi:hypothetical protein
MSCCLDLRTSAARSDAVYCVSHMQAMIPANANAMPLSSPRAAETMGSPREFQAPAFEVPLLLCTTEHPVDRCAPDLELLCDGRWSHALALQSANLVGVDGRGAALVDAGGFGFGYALQLAFAPQVRLELSERLGLNPRAELAGVQPIKASRRPCGQRSQS